MSLVETIRSVFPYLRVKELNSNDFYIGSRTPTMLKDPNPTVILFYSPNNQESLELAPIWARLAERVAGVTMAAVNVLQNETLMKEFQATNNNLDHPLAPYAISGVPTILVYRDGWPQAYYNGEKSEEAILQWIFVLAVKVGYKEPDTRYTGISPIQSTNVVKDRREGDFIFPTSSRDFTSGIGAKNEEPKLTDEEKQFLENLTDEELKEILTSSTL